MKKKLTTIIIPLALIGYMMFQGGCVKEDFDTVPMIKDTSNLVTTASIAEIKVLLTSTSIVKKVGDLATPIFKQTINDRNVANNVKDVTSIVIEGYVTSSDSTGNFYEVVTIQDATGGIDIKINTSDLYTVYRLKPGQKVKVKTNNLYLGTYYSEYQLGAAIVETGALDIVGIPAGDVNQFIERTGYRKKLIPDTLTLAQINADVSFNYAQKLVCIKDVQFNQPAGGYSVPGTSTNRMLVDSLGNTLLLRTSGYATFAEEAVPSGKGTITGVLTRYNTTRQLLIRDLNDVKLTKKRYEVTVPTPNKTIAQLKAMCTANLVPITSDVVIEGVICGNDKSGNIYTQLFIQDDNTGIEFKVYITGLFAEYPVGAKVVINCKGLYLGIEKGVVKLGGLFNSSFGKLDASIFYQKVFVTEYNLPVVPISTTIATLSDDLIGRLVSIDDVQFIDSDLGKSWSESTKPTNRYVCDIYTNKIITNKLIVYTSNYADFATATLPTGRGKITAILSKYNTSYELIVRNLSEVRMIKSRTVSDYLLKEDFSSTVTFSNISLTGWTNYNETGTKKWRGNVYSNDRYAEMTAYQSGDASNIVWLITPAVSIPTKGVNVLSFSSEWHHWVNGTALEVFISTDYNGSNVTGAGTTWTKLDARVPVYADGQYNWVNSATDLSAYTGKTIYVAFKYTGSGTLTTGFNIDNVSIYNIE